MNNKTLYLFVIYNVWNNDKIIGTNYYYEEKSLIEDITYETKAYYKKKITKKCIQNYINKKTYEDIKNPRDIYISILEIKYEASVKLFTLLNLLDYLKKYYETQKEYFEYNEIMRVYNFTDMYNALLEIE